MEPETEPGEPAAEEPPQRGLATTAAVAAGLAVLVGVLWLVGGLKETPEEPPGAPGRPIDQGRFTVTVQGARIATAKDPLTGKLQRYVVVRLRVINKGKKTASFDSFGLAAGVAARTRSGDLVKPDQVEGTVAGEAALAAQPGLPAEAAAMWKLTPAETPTRFTIGLRKWTFDHGFTDKSFDWRVDLEDDPRLAGQVTLPVEPS